ncbi:MAG: hydrogenase iron-sulfur subunit [Gemmatimonadales bacterium]|jgi:coenzyme F420-reducing hydrogenase delta subunit
MTQDAEDEPELKILVFSTETISDPGIDFAGSAHLHYSPAAVVISLPCSSGIRPQWIVHALESGFDGVFIAADGTDCAYVPDCTRRTGDVFGRTQTLLSERGHDPRRLKMAAICSVCGESFVKHVSDFERELVTLDGKGGG